MILRRFRNDTVILEVSVEGGRRRVVKNNANFTPECRGSLHYYQDREGKNVSQRWQTRLNSCFRDTSTFLLTHVKIPVFFKPNHPLYEQQSLLRPPPAPLLLLLIFSLIKSPQRIKSSTKYVLTLFSPSNTLLISSYPRRCRTNHRFSTYRVPRVQILTVYLF